MIQKINEDLGEESTGRNVINFIICDNSLLLTKQTAARVSSEVNLPHTDEKYVEFSSRNDGVAQRTADAVLGKIMVDGVKNIICCTNGKRVADISSLITRINRSPIAAKCGGFIFKIWLDEADKFNNHITKKLYPLAEANENIHCFCLTATPDTLFKKFQYMNVLPIENTTLPNYHGWTDNQIEIRVNEHGSTEGFVSQIINEVIDKGNYLPGTKWYIPANQKKSSHMMMRDLLTVKGFAVFVVNGDGLELTIPSTADGERTRIIVPKTKELHELVREMYGQHNLVQYPVAITGNICVGRGISIMHEQSESLCEFIFDYGILSETGKKSEASQNAGRLKGNYKHWNGYKPPIVFTTKKFDEIATEWEERSRELAKLAFSRDAIEPSIITKKEFTGITRTEYEFDYHVFDTDDEAILWVKKHLHKSMRKQHSSDKAPAAIRESGNNPTLEYLLGRKWGLREGHEEIRKIIMNNGKFCVYWRKFPSIPSNYIKPQ